jgi:hypothetical protein
MPTPVNVISYHFIRGLSEAVAPAFGYHRHQGPLPEASCRCTCWAVEGEEEWNSRKYGGPKHRFWRKTHIRIDQETLKIPAIEATGSSIRNAPELPDLLNQVPTDDEIGSVTADGAYHTRKFHDAIVARKVHAVIMPRKNTKLWKPPSHGLKANHERAMDTLSARARNETMRSSKYLERALWRQLAGYHRRSRISTKMHCVKLLGQRLSARDYQRKVAKIQICAAILKRFTTFGIP